jgi:hypothetical protein
MNNKFELGDKVEKKSGSSWRGTVVGFYSTALNPDGVCVESSTEAGSVQIYPKHALQAVKPADSIVSAVQADLSARSERGVKKYGVTLDRTDLTESDWKQHLYEELLDAALYLKRSTVSNRHLNLISQLENATKNDASRTTIYGTRLGDMDDQEIRAAAYWLASRAEDQTI